MKIHPEFGPVPTFASAEREIPEGWYLLQVFQNGRSIDGVVEVDTEAGYALIYTGQVLEADWESVRVAGNYTLEWMDPPDGLR